MTNGKIRSLSAIGIIAAALALISVVSPAFAGEGSNQLAAAPNWTGFYLGANAGYGWGRRDVSYVGNDNVSQQQFGTIFPASNGVTPGNPNLKSDGALGGAQLGYNLQLSQKWLVGVETDFDWAGIKGNGSSGGTVFSGFAFASPFTASVDEQIKWFGTIRARFGYLPRENLLAYFTAGFAYGQVEHNGSYQTSKPLSVVGVPFGYSCLAASACFTGSSNSVLGGWTLGAGLEFLVAHNVTFKAEYMYVNLGGGSLTEAALNNGGAPATLPSSFNANFDRASFNVARVGLNYRF